MTTKKWITGISITLLMPLTGCKDGTEDEASAAVTAAMQIAEAQLTQNAAAQPTATQTLIPTETTLPTDTLTATLAPTSTAHTYSAPDVVAAVMWPVSYPM